jgi:polysaccharide deacetylase family protein (PEP-CTERM system associated)
MRTAVPPIRHALSIDVEDWYHDGGPPAGAAPVVERVEQNTWRVLELLEQAGARATFFFVGEVAERHPRLVRAALAAGHELGSHGHRHRHLSTLLHREFRDDVARSLAVLQDVAGVAVHGFRAPYFSIKAGVRWPIELLAELGLRYDSSVLPIDRPPGLELVCPRVPFRHPSGLWEVPVAILQLGRFWHLPLASGAGLRLLPPAIFERLVARFEREIGAGVFYLHPWELDPESPTGAGRGRVLLRIGRARLRGRLATVLRERAFVPIAEAFPSIVTEATGDA